MSKEIIPWTTDPDRLMLAPLYATGNFFLRTVNGVRIYDAVDCVVYDCVPEDDSVWAVDVWRVRRPEHVAPQIDFRRYLIKEEAITDFRFAAEIYIADTAKPLYHVRVHPKENTDISPEGKDAVGYTVYALTSILSASMQDYELFEIDWVSYNSVK